MKKNRLYIVALILINLSKSFGQTTERSDYFVNLDFGVQMSGIKSEDFIKSNYSPLTKLSIGKWMSSKIGVQVGYQGWYFNTIADDIKHYYNFYFLEGIIDAKNILSNINKSRVHHLLFHAGVGYFNNNHYGNSTFHGVLGMSNNFTVSKKIAIKFDISAIVGWDIYQGDDDILPNVSLGVIYFLPDKNK